jgi:hypothetical protein
MELRWRRPRDLAVTVGVVGAPSSGIELVLSKNYLLVAQIRVICKNGPQVSIDDIKLSIFRCRKLPLNIFFFFAIKLRDM